MFRGGHKSFTLQRPANDAGPPPPAEDEEERDHFGDDESHMVPDTIVALRYLQSLAAPSFLQQAAANTSTGGAARRRARTLPSDLGQKRAVEKTPQLLTNRKVKAGPESLPKLVFQHQLYTQLQNPTAVKREVEELRENGQLFVFDLTPAGFATTQGFGNHQESALMEEAEYFKWFERVSERWQRANGDKKGPFPPFKKLLKEERRFGPVFSHDELIEYFGEEEMITILFKNSILISHGLHSYAMSIPGLGGWASQLFAGRKELARSLKRKRNHETHVHLLEQKGLLQSCFSVKFHLTDLEGLEWVTM